MAREEGATISDLISEANFQRNVITVAQTAGWMCQHSRKAMVRDGKFVTPISGDVGYVDLTMVRGQHLLFIELKTNTGKLRPEQVAWGEALLRAGADYRVWRPRDWTTDIVPTLTRRYK